MSGGARGRVGLGALLLAAATLLLLALATLWAARWQRAPAASVPRSDAPPAHPAPAPGTAPGEVPRALDAAQAAADAALAARLSLLVVDAQGAAVPGARLELWDAGRDVLADDEPPPFALRRIADTDAAGHASLAVEGPDQQLVAFREVSGCSGVFTVAEARALLDEHGDVVLVLRPRARVAGAVLHADGQPAADAPVEFRLTGGLEGGGRARLPGACRTDELGSFQREVDAGAFLAVSAIWSDRITPEAALVTRGGEQHVVRLRFEGDYAIRGVLQAPDGRPVPAARVDHWLAQEGAHHEQGLSPWELGLPSGPPAPVDEAGAFELLVRTPGRYRLVGRAEDWAPSAVAEVTLTDLQPRASVTLMLAAPATISGVVVEETGEPLIGRRVRAVPAGWRFDHTQTDAPDARTLFGASAAVTDAQGRFTLEGLHPDGSYRVSCILDGEVEPPAVPRVLVAPDVPAGTTELRLVATDASLQGTVLTGRVLDSLTSQPVDDFDVSVESRTDDYAYLKGWQVVREPEGRFRIGGLVPGDAYRLTVRGGHGNVPRGRVDTPWLTLTDPPEEVLVVLPRCGSFEVFVQGPGHSPLRAADVRLLRVADGPRESVFAPLGSDERGRAYFAPVEPGRYAIRAVRGALAGEVLRDLGDGEAATLTLLLEPEN